MRPRESSAENANVRSAIQDAIQRRVHSMMLEADQDKRRCPDTSRLVGPSLREDVVSVACRVLDNCIQAESLDTTDARLQLQFVRRMLSKAIELDTVAAQLGNQATHDLLVAPHKEAAQVVPIRLTQHLKAPLPPAARGAKTSAKKPKL